MTTLKKPKALLVDFGGVIVTTHTLEGWQQRLADHVIRELESNGAADESLTQTRVERDIAMAAKADSHWKDAMSRLYEPAELTHVQFWEGFVAGDWPSVAQAYVIQHATELCRVMGELRQERVLRDGFIELLDTAKNAGIPVVIVSNSLCGRVHRDWLRTEGYSDWFAAEIYSDEAGVRKPNPQMIHLGADAAGVTAAESWYVGDNFDRDVLCGLRAGVGGNILMEAGSTYDMPYDLQIQADAVVADPHELHKLLAEALTSERK